MGAGPKQGRRQHADRGSCHDCDQAKPFFRRSLARGRNGPGADGVDLDGRQVQGLASRGWDLLARAALPIHGRRLSGLGRGTELEEVGGRDQSRQRTGEEGMLRTMAAEGALGRLEGPEQPGPVPGRIRCAAMGLQGLGQGPVDGGPAAGEAWRRMAVEGHLDPVGAEALVDELEGKALDAQARVVDHLEGVRGQREAIDPEGDRSGRALEAAADQIDGLDAMGKAQGLVQEGGLVPPGRGGLGLPFGRHGLEGNRPAQKAKGQGRRDHLGLHVHGQP